MSFLALSSLQAAILVLVTAGTIVALYLLKLRHRRVVVPSSMLWTRVLDERHAHSLWEKLRKLISILIAVTIALLIAIALGRPHIEWLTGRNERIVIVLDTSPTMAARTSEGSTRWQRAVEEAAALLGSGGPTTQFRISDTSGQTTFPFTTNRIEARQMIDQMSPRSIEPRFPEVDDPEAEVYFISDGVFVIDVPAPATRISVFEPAENAGITAFEIRSIPSSPLSYEAYLEVQNFGLEASDVGITVSGTGSQRISRSVRLAAGEVHKEVFDLSQFDGGEIRAAIRAESDAMTIDDIAFAYLPVKRTTRIMLVTRGNRYLETLLRLSTHVELVQTDPAAYRETSDIDVYVFDRFAPSSPPSKPALIIGTPSAPWLRETRGMVQNPSITAWAEDHPVMQHVPLYDIMIERAMQIDPGDLTIVAASNQTPLIVASQAPRWVMLTFDLDSSDFPFHVGFPVFVENVLSWFGREQVALRRTLGIVEVPVKGADIRTIDGASVASHHLVNDTIFEAREPGLYTAIQGDTQLYVAVNLASRTLSDVNKSVFRDQAVSASGAYLLRRELWFYMLLAALLLISVEWFTYHRRMTL